MSKPAKIEVNMKPYEGKVVGYQFRAECPRDALLVKLILGWHVSLWIEQQAMLAGNNGEPAHYIPDVDVTVYIKEDGPGLKEILWALSANPHLDLHVAWQSFKPVEEYDGERNQDRPDLRDCNPESLKKIVDSMKAQIDGYDGFTNDLFQLGETLNDNLFALQRGYR